MTLSKLIKWTSKKAYKEVSEDITANMRRQVLAVFVYKNKPLSDRDIAEELGYQDMNKVRPRRNELVKLGKLKEVGSKICPITKKRVLIWELNK